MTCNFSKAVLLGLLITGVSACGGDKKRTSPPATPPVAGTPAPPASLAAKFGAGFASIFGASANAEPKDPAPGDIVAVNASADPIDF